MLEQLPKIPRIKAYRYVKFGINCTHNYYTVRPLSHGMILIKESWRLNRLFFLFFVSPFLPSKHKVVKWSWRLAIGVRIWKQWSSHLIMQFGNGRSERWYNFGRAMPPQTLTCQSERPSASALVLAIVFHCWCCLSVAVLKETRKGWS